MECGAALFRRCAAGERRRAFGQSPAHQIGTAGDEQDSPRIPLDGSRHARPRADSARRAGQGRDEGAGASATGEFKYEALHNWGELPPHIKWGNTHNVVEDSQGNIYVHHTVHAASESADTVVVFDRNGKFMRSWGKEYRGVAHGMWLRKEGSEEFLYLTVNAANARMQPPPELPATVVKATLKGEIVYKIQGPPDIPQYKSNAEGTGPAPVQPDEHRHRAQRRSLRRRRLRLVLHQSLQRQRRVSEHVRRAGDPIPA